MDMAIAQVDSAFMVKAGCSNWVNKSPPARRLGTAKVPQKADSIAAAARTENVCQHRPLRPPFEGA